MKNYTHAPLYRLGQSFEIQRQDVNVEKAARKLNIRENWVRATIKKFIPRTPEDAEEMEFTARTEKDKKIARLLIDGFVSKLSPEKRVKKILKELKISSRDDAVSMFYGTTGSGGIAHEMAVWLVCLFSPKPPKKE